MNTCQLCDRSFTRKWNLSRHVTHAHGVIGKSTESIAGVVSRHLPYEHKRVVRGEPISEYVSQKQVGEGNQPNGSYIDDEMDSNEDASDTGGDFLFGGGANTADSDIETSSNDPVDLDSETSSDGLDDCESSSEDPSEDSSEAENDSRDQEGGLDAVNAAGEDETLDVREDAVSTQEPMYWSFALWSNSDRGVFLPWVSCSRKPLVVQHRDWLEELLTSSRRLRKEYIMEASESQLDTISEMAVNLLEGRAPLPAPILRDFNRLRGVIRKIASEDTSYDELRRTLKAEHDYGLPLLLKNAIPKCIKSRGVVF